MQIKSEPIYTLTLTSEELNDVLSALYFAYDEREKDIADGYIDDREVPAIEEEMSSWESMLEVIKKELLKGENK